MATNKAVSEPATPSSDIEQKRHYQRLIADLAFRASEDKPDSFDIASSVVDAIMAADDLDGMFDAVESSLVSLKDATDLHNVPVSVIGLHYAKSDTKYEANGLGAFVIIDLVTDAGEPRTISTGAPNVVAFLRASELKGYATAENPLRIRFTARGTDNGTLLSVARP